MNANLLMQQRGRLTEWNDDRGYGFISPLDDGPRVFVHVSQFPPDKRRPLVMDLVTYDVGPDDRGRPRATNVLYMAPTGPRRAKRPAGEGKSKRSLAILAVSAVLIIALAAVLSSLSAPTSQRSSSSPAKSASSGVSSSSDQIIAEAFENHSSGLQVAGEGVVERVLSDDNDGSRHQRFILRLASGQTLLVAHNIDLAPRVSSLAPGGSVAFNGVYEWNAEGGVIHWTHRDPDGQHVPGWLRYEGATYQ